MSKNINIRIIELISLIILICGFFVLRTTITGFVVLDHIDTVNVNFSYNSSYVWLPSDQGVLDGIGISGYLEGDSVLVLLDNKTVYNYGYGVESPLAFIVFNGSGEIKLSFEYGDGIGYDNNNDGIAYIEDVIDFKIGAGFDFEADYSKVCTKYVVNNLDTATHVCYGSSECCAFLNLGSSGNNWDEAFILNYGKYDAGNKNTVRAQVIYYDVDFSVPYSHIYNSEILELNADFVEGIYFDDYCLESCSGLGLENSSYIMNILVDGVLHISNISYRLANISVEGIVENTTSNITTKQYGARLGQPVRWEKRIKVNDSVSDLTVDLPALAGNVSVLKIDGDSGIKKEIEADIDNEKLIESIEPIVSVTGNAVSGFDFISLVKRDFGKISHLLKITGFAVVEEDKVTVNIEENIENNDEIVVEYYTDAPYAEEIELDERSKEITIIGPDSVHYTDVLAYSDLPSQVSDASSIKLYWIVNGTKTTASFDAYDSDSDGLYDYIEWIVPHLSNQTYEIILITKAILLDENRTFVSDIYDYVKAQDGNWSEIINSGEYVRVTFERNLTNKNDVTVYARSACNVSIRINDVDVPCEIYQKKIRLDELRNMVGESR